MVKLAARLDDCAEVKRAIDAIILRGEFNVALDFSNVSLISREVLDLLYDYQGALLDVQGSLDCIGVSLEVKSRLMEVGLN